jgi:hypothetical protein
MLCPIPRPPPSNSPLPSLALPQVFKVPIGYDVAGGGAESVEFVGAWEKVEELNEMNEIPKDVLEANPDIKTLDSVLANVATSA